MAQLRGNAHESAIRQQVARHAHELRYRLVVATDAPANARKHVAQHVVGEAFHQGKQQSGHGQSESLQQQIQRRDDFSTAVFDAGNFALSSATGTAAMYCVTIDTVSPFNSKRGIERARASARLPAAAGDHDAGIQQAMDFRLDIEQVARTTGIRIDVAAGHQKVLNFSSGKPCFST